MYSINETPAQFPTLSKINESFVVEKLSETSRISLPFILSSTRPACGELVECQSDSTAAVCKVIDQALDECYDFDDSDDKTSDEEEELRRNDLLMDNMGLFQRQLSKMRSQLNNNCDDDSESDDEEEEDELYKFETSFSDLYAAFHKRC